ncbi:MAG: hypothetical protein EP341_07260 [Sphingomonadales bacterium]|nr:MAG: hypothetical protein EP341_07260 [Sphingomonadales bacterium]
MIASITDMLLHFWATIEYPADKFAIRPEWLTELYQSVSRRSRSGSIGLTDFFLLYIFIDWYLRRDDKRSALLLGILVVSILFIKMTFLLWDSPIGLGTQLDHVIANFQAA